MSEQTAKATRTPASGDDNQDLRERVARTEQIVADLAQDVSSLAKSVEVQGRQVREAIQEQGDSVWKAVDSLRETVGAVSTNVATARESLGKVDWRQVVAIVSGMLGASGGVASVTIAFMWLMISPLQAELRHGDEERTAAVQMISAHSDLDQHAGSLRDSATLLAEIRHLTDMDRRQDDARTLWETRLQKEIADREAVVVSRVDALSGQLNRVEARLYSFEESRLRELSRENASLRSRLDDRIP